MAVNDLTSNVDTTYPDDPQDPSRQVHQQDHDEIHGWLKTAGDISAAVLTANSVLGDLSNVTITSVTNDEVLAWNGSAWVNQTAAEAGLATSGHTHDHDALTGFVANEHIDWTTDQGATNIHANNITGYSATGHQHVEGDITDLDHLTIEEVQDNLGTAFLVQGTDISLTYDDVANTLTIASTATGVTDHGALTGLADDDHTQYFNAARHDAHDHSTALGTATTTDLAEGTNLYYTTTRANTDIDARVNKAFVDALNVDADTLDGLDSTEFVRLNPTGLQIIDGDIRLTSGRDLTFYDHNNTYPTADGGFLWDLNNDSAKVYAFQPSSDNIDFVFKISDNVGATDRFVFWIDSFTGSQDDVYPLIMHGTRADFDVPVYISGNQILTTANEGSGNGLDADTVDGQHASAFALAAAGVTGGDSHDHAGGDGAQIDHGGLAGLADDDHTQYHTNTRHDAHDHSTAMGTVVLEDISDVVETAITTGDVLRWNGTNWVNYADSNFAASGHNHDAAYVDVSGDTMTGFLTLNADPTSSLHAATKQYVDGIAAGLDWKASARAIATSNITLSGTQTVDGVSLLAGDRVLVAGQTTASQNGIYVVASGAWTRSTDADSSADLNSGAAVFVEEGTTNADTGWVLTTDGTITLGTTSLTFTQFTSLGQVTAGAGLTKTGNSIDVIAGNASISVAADSISVGFDGTLPVALTPDIAGAVGSAVVPARRDHVHNVPADTAVGISNSSTNTEGNSTSFARANHTHAVTGFALTSHNHAASAITSGTLAVARGGTGIASYTTGNYVRASAATTLEQRTPAQVLSDIGAAATSHNHAAADITSGTLAVARGGTGIASYTTGNYIYASGATTLAERTPAQVLSDIGAASSGHGHTFSDHGNLTGLADDDHTQYLNAARHDAHDHSTALGTATTTDLAEGTNLYYTTTRANSAIDTRVTKSFVDALNVDADTLDGVDSTGFVAVGGDVMTGTLTMDGLTAGVPQVAFRAGDNGTATNNYHHIGLGYNGNNDYRHSIATRHNAGGQSNNAFDFYVWEHGVNAIGDLGTKKVLTLDAGLGSEFFGGLSVDGNAVLTTADEGTGNGLDADTVDGQHASAFATSGHNHDAAYVNVTGDTMTGALISPAGTAGAPAIGVGATDTGFYLSGGSLKFTVGGAQKGYMNTASQFNLIGGGSAGAPAYTMGNDTTTGMYSAGTGQVNFAVSGVHAVTIDAAGEMGIGTATPERTLDVAGSGRIRQENAMEFGGVGAADSKFSIQYNATTESLDFNYLG